jgi:hypothetical protein
MPQTCCKFWGSVLKRQWGGAGMVQAAAAVLCTGASGRGEAGSKETLESLVVRAVWPIYRGGSRWLVHGALVDCYSEPNDIAIIVINMAKAERQDNIQSPGWHPDALL